MTRDFPFLSLGVIVATLGVMLALFTFRDGRTAIEAYDRITREMEALRVETYLEHPLADFTYRADPEKLARYATLLAQEKPGHQTRIVEIFPLHFQLRKELDAFWARYRAEYFVPGRGGMTRLKWKAREEELEHLIASTPILRLAFTPARPFSLKTFLLSPFLHHGHLHLCVQLFFFWIVAGSLESQIGRGRLLGAFLAAAYFAAAIGGVVFSGERVFLIGFTGALFGLFGLFVAYFGATPLVIHLGFDDLILPAYAVIPGYFVIDALLRIDAFPTATYAVPWGGVAAFALGALSLLLFGREGGLVYARRSEARREPLSRQERKRIAEQNAEIDEARNLIAQGDVERGIIRLKTILGQDPQNIPAHQVLFETLLMHGSEEKARLEANKLINKYLILDQRAEALEVYRTFNLHYPEAPLDIPREILMGPEESG